VEVWARRSAVCCCLLCFACCCCYLHWCLVLFLLQLLLLIHTCACAASSIDTAHIELLRCRAAIDSARSTPAKVAAREPLRACVPALLACLPAFACQLLASVCQRAFARLLAPLVRSLRPFRALCIVAAVPCFLCLAVLLGRYLPLGRLLHCQPSQSAARPLCAPSQAHPHIAPSTRTALAYRIRHQTHFLLRPARPGRQS